jgi:hypothetical protein
MAEAPQTQPSGKIIGMYVHQHWPYNHPYAARTWTLEDWRGYADGMRRIGYNAFLVWPVLETMPDPLAPSDQASLDKVAAVIDMLHREMGMRVYLTLCPNVGCRDEEAAKATFEKRHFFYCDTQFNIEAAPDPKATEPALARVQASLRRTETYTTRMIEAMKQATREMK